MKKLNLLLVTLTFLFISNKSFSQEWTPPAPVKSAYIDALVGTWTSNPYEFMGSTNNDVVTYNMIINGQYLEVDIKRTDDKGFLYEAKEILTPASDGSMQGSYFDMFKNQNTSYTARMDGNKIILTSSSPIGTGSRELIIDGNTMTSNVAFTMPDKSGTDMAQNITITYKKTN